MAFCDGNIERSIIKNNFDYLQSLSPVRRFVEKFRLETEALTLEIREEDKILGWFRFDGAENEALEFSEAKLSDEEKAVIDAPWKFGCITTVDRGHTLVDYGEILNGGLVFYRKKIEAFRAPKRRIPARHVANVGRSTDFSCKG